MEYDNARKIVINNHIVGLRHAVRKARVGVVWKLSREIKQLKSRHGDEKIINKCHRKADKFVKIVQLLKKIKDDEVTKFVVVNFDDLQETPSDTKIDLKKDAMRRLACHKALKSKIEEFRKTYPDYQIYLQSKNPKSLVSSKVKNETKSKSPINDGWVVENVSNTLSKLEDTAETEEKIISESMDEDDNIEKETNESPEKPNAVIKKEKIRKKDKKSPDSITPDSSKNSTSMKPCKNKSVKIISKLVEVKKLNITDSSIQLEEVVKQNIIPNSDSNQDEGNEEDSNNIEVNREIDPFFMTGNNNEHYMSIAVPKSTTFNDEKRWNDNIDKFPHRKKHFIANMPEQNKRNNHFNINEKKNRGNKREIQKIKNISTDKGELHPSWAARKKQQDIMKVAFQGKKIVFSDD